MSAVGRVVRMNPALRALFAAVLAGLIVGNGLILVGYTSTVEGTAVPAEPALAVASPSQEQEPTSSRLATPPVAVVPDPPPAPEAQPPAAGPAPDPAPSTETGPGRSPDAGDNTPADGPEDSDGRDEPDGSGSSGETEDAEEADDPAGPETAMRRCRSGEIPAEYCRRFGMPTP